MRVHCRFPCVPALAATITRAAESMPPLKMNATASWWRRPAGRCAADTRARARSGGAPAARTSSPPLSCGGCCRLGWRAARGSGRRGFAHAATSGTAAAFQSLPALRASDPRAGAKQNRRARVGGPRRARPQRFRPRPLARPGRSPAEALPSNAYHSPPLRAPLGGRSRENCAKRARLKLRERSARAAKRSARGKKVFPKIFTSLATFWSKNQGVACPSRGEQAGYRTKPMALGSWQNADF